jgi:hypothetical protein
MYEMHKNPSNASNVIDYRVGTFVKQGLVSLFENLLINGKLSALETLYVGAAIEEVDMLDLMQAIENTDNEDMRKVYENLLCGSRNHLRTYINQIAGQGITYEAQFLNQDDIDAIVGSQTKRRATLC